MSKQIPYKPEEPVTDIMLMINIRPPQSTRLTIWGEKGPDVIEWHDDFEIVDMYINGKPFHGLSDSHVEVCFTFSSQKTRKRTLMERIIGTMPSYWASFFIGYKGHYCVFIDMNIARFDFISQCNTLIISSRDMRDEKGKPLKKPLTYAGYIQKRPTSVVDIVNFSKYADMPEDGGGKRKPKASLQSYFEAMPEQHRIFN